MKEHEIRAALQKGERLTDSETQNVLQQNERGYYIVSNNGKRMKGGSIKGFYDAVYYWQTWDGK